MKSRHVFLHDIGRFPIEPKSFKALSSGLGIGTVKTRHTAAAIAPAMREVSTTQPVIPPAAPAQQMPVAAASMATRGSRGWLRLLLVDALVMVMGLAVAGTAGQMFWLWHHKQPLQGIFKPLTLPLFQLLLQFKLTDWVATVATTWAVYWLVLRLLVGHTVGSLLNHRKTASLRSPS